MALALVPRSARALAAHLNSMYRVLKGVDQDSLWLRLASGGGSFEVRNSVTNAALFRVTDAGATLSGAVSLPADSVTSANIVDGSIEGRDIAPATITADKLTGGIGIPAESITNAHILDGTVRMQELAANAVTNSQRATGGTSNTTNSTTFVDFDAGMNVSYASSGGMLTVFFITTVTTQTAGDYVVAGVFIAGTDYGGTSYQPAAIQHRGTIVAIGRAQPGVGAVDIRPRWRHSTAARSAQSVSGEATLLIIEHKR